MFTGAQHGFAFLAGALTTLSPCVLPILPLIVGAAVKKDRLAPIFIAAGLAVSFTAVGWSIASFGSFLGLTGEVVRTLGAIALGLFGVAALSERAMAGFSRLIRPLSDRASQRMNRIEGESRRDNFLLGALLGVGWSPCSGPTLGAAVTIAAQQGGGLPSLVTMLLFSLGAVLPLCFVAYGAATFVRKLQGKVLATSGRIKKAFGALMVLLSLAILTGADKWIEAKALEIAPESYSDLFTKF